MEELLISSGPGVIAFQKIFLRKSLTELFFTNCNRS